MKLYIFLFIMMAIVICTLHSTRIKITDDLVLSGDVIKITEQEVFLLESKTLYIIGKNIIIEPLEYKSIHLIQKETKRVKYNSLFVEYIRNEKELSKFVKRYGKKITGTNTFIYLDLFGPGFLYSLNLEQRVYKRFLVRLGASCWVTSLDNSFHEITAFPVGMVRTFGNKTSKLEIGGGVTFLQHSKQEIFSFDTDEEKDSDILCYLDVGVRIESEPLFFKLSFTPFIDEKTIKPWGALSWGVCF